MSDDEHEREASHPINKAISLAQQRQRLQKAKEVTQQLHQDVDATKSTAKSEPLPEAGTTLQVNDDSATESTKPKTKGKAKRKREESSVEADEPQQLKNRNTTPESGETNKGPAEEVLDMVINLTKDDVAAEAPPAATSEKDQKNDAGQTAPDREPPGKRVKPPKDFQLRASKLVFVDDEQGIVKDAELKKLMSKTARYFDEDAGVQINSKRCFNCGGLGHLSITCTNAARIRPCTLCAQLGHGHFDCPNVLCFKCGRPGHKSKDCTHGRVEGWESAAQICNRCGSTDPAVCPCVGKGDYFRYEGGCKSTYSPDDLARCRCFVCGKQGHLCCKAPPRLPGWNQSCYYCASTEHRGEDCPLDHRAHLQAERAGDVRRAQLERDMEEQRERQQSARRGAYYGHDNRERHGGGRPQHDDRRSKSAAPALGRYGAHHRFDSDDEDDYIQEPLERIQRQARGGRYDDRPLVQHNSRTPPGFGQSHSERDMSSRYQDLPPNPTYGLQQHQPQVLVYRDQLQPQYDRGGGGVVDRYQSNMRGGAGGGGVPGMSSPPSAPGAYPATHNYQQPQYGRQDDYYGQQRQPPQYAHYGQTVAAAALRSVGEMAYVQPPRPSYDNLRSQSAAPYMTGGGHYGGGGGNERPRHASHAQQQAARQDSYDMHRQFETQRQSSAPRQRGGGYEDQYREQPYTYQQNRDSSAGDPYQQPRQGGYRAGHDAHGVELRSGSHPRSGGSGRPYDHDQGQRSGRKRSRYN